MSRTRDLMKLKKLLDSLDNTKEGGLASLKKYVLPPIALTGTIAAIRGIESIVSSLSFKRNLRRLYNQYPNLKKFNKGKVQFLYATIYRLYPDLAKNPGVVGPWIEATLTSGVYEGINPLEAIKITEKKPKTFSQLMAESFVESVSGAVPEQTIKQLYSDYFGASGG